MSYYSRFRIFIGTPLWRYYIRYQYIQSVRYLEKLNFQPKFEKDNFTALLCGVGNETTANEFIKFNLSKNSKAMIWIIDLGKEQIEAVLTLVKSKYPNSNIKVTQTNALNLTNLVGKSNIDWIETDAVFEFFDYKGLKHLLNVWNEILQGEGFITTSATSTNNFFEKFLDKIKIWVGDKWLGVKVYSHSRNEIVKIFKNEGFIFVDRSAGFGYFRRYTAIKS